MVSFLSKRGKNIGRIEDSAESLDDFLNAKPEFLVAGCFPRFDT